VLMAQTSVGMKDNIAWYLDSSCSTHMTGRKEWFVQLNVVSQERIRFADDSCLTAEGYGRVGLKNYDGKEVIVENVLYVPRLKTNRVNLEEKSLKVYDQTKKLIIHANLSSNRIF